MIRSARSKAEEQFTAALKKDQEALQEKEIERQKEMEHRAKLKALRLAKQAVDKEEAERVAAEKKAPKAKKVPATAKAS